MDVNGDGFVDVMDVVTLVNLALNFEQSREERNLLNDILHNLKSIRNKNEQKHVFRNIQSKLKRNIY